VIIRCFATHFHRRDRIRNCDFYFGSARADGRVDDDSPTAAQRRQEAARDRVPIHSRHDRQGTSVQRENHSVEHVEEPELFGLALVRHRFHLETRAERAMDLPVSPLS
jgi:hypothetical protein